MAKDGGLEKLTELDESGILREALEPQALAGEQPIGSGANKGLLV